MTNLSPALLTGNAYNIVSGDNDLLVLKDYEGIEIITVAQFFERFGV